MHNWNLSEFLFLFLFSVSVFVSVSVSALRRATYNQVIKTNAAGKQKLCATDISFHCDYLCNE